MQLENKEIRLKEILTGYSRLAVAFSGGVDSTYLLKIAFEVLGENVTAITARSSATSSREFKEAVDFAASLGVRHIIYDFDELSIEGFRHNPKDRCYICKKAIFTKILSIARENDICIVADGTNYDDLKDYRPGMKALSELHVVSPLLEAGLRKEDIRELSRQAGLPTWDKPALACLATRIPYGHEITKEKLAMIENAEEFLSQLGFSQIRVRHHGDIARIEVPVTEITEFCNEGTIGKVNSKLKGIGFRYVTLDLEGYRTGNMNLI